VIKSSNRCVTSDQKCSSSGRTPSGIILLTSSLSDIQYCRKVGCTVAGNVVSSPARDMQGCLLWVLCVVW